MLYLVTGTPGSGKTQKTLKEVTQNAHFQKRDVYYWGIPGLSKDLGWTELENAEEWDSAVPDGSVLIIDEAHTIFPRLKVGNDKPPHYIPLSTHRHRGLDIFIITQYPNDLDIYVRGRVGWHWHLKRKMGVEASVVHIANEAFYPGDKDAMSKCETEVYKFDKKVWELYDSATVHNVQKRFPKKLLWAPVLIIFGVFIAYTAFANLKGMTSDEEQPQIAKSSGTPKQSTLTILDPESTQIAYLQQYVPRVPGQPWTAPRYDGLNKPVSVPKPAGCIRNITKNTCRCISQQGTPLDVKRSFCLAWMAGDRMFDDTTSDLEYSYGKQSKNFEDSDD
jgi:zona occludens toxin